MPPRRIPTITCIHCGNLLVKFKGRWYIFGGGSVLCKKNPRSKYHVPSR